MRHISRAAVTILAAQALFWTGPARGYEVTMTNNVQPPAALGAVTNTGAGTAANPYTYTFTTADGLNMKPATTAYNIVTANGTSFTLDLTGGPIDGAGGLSTIVLGDMQSSGGITITNAAAISLGSIDTHVDNGNAGKITVSHRGALTVGNIDSHRIGSNSGNRSGNVGSISFNGDAGSAGGTKGAFSSGVIGAYGANSPVKATVSIQNYTDVTVNGGILGYPVARDAHGVDVTIGIDPVPVGNITIRGPISIWAWSYSYVVVGSLAISSTGNVLLQDGSGVGQDVIGYVGDYGSPGNVTIKHDGKLVFNDISSTTSPGGNGGAFSTMIILLNGDVLGNQASGALMGRDIIGASYAIGRHPSHSVNISGYTSVSLRTVDAGGYLTSNNGDSGSGGQDTGYISITNIAGPIAISGNLTTESLNGFSSGTKYAGPITLSAAGDITVGGTIDANCARGNAYDGALTLTNSGVSAVIRVGSFDMIRVKSPTLNAGGGKSYVVHGLANVPTATPGSSGLSAGADGKTIYYSRHVPANFYLLANGPTYNLGSGKGQLAPNMETGSAVNWTGAASSNFEKGGNWQGGSAPAQDVTSHVATFGAKGGLLDPQLTMNHSVAGINFTNAGWTLSGGDYALTVGRDGIGSAGSGTNTVSAQLNLDDSGGLWTIGSGNELAVSGVISGTGYLTKDGPGTLTLAASNAHSRSTAIWAGVLNVQHNHALGSSALSATGGVVNFVTAAPEVASLEDGPGVVGNGAVVLGKADPGGTDCTMTVGSDSRSTTFSTAIGNAAGKTGGLTKVGAGTLTLAGSNTFSGEITVSAGTLKGNARASSQGNPLGNSSGAIKLNGGGLGFSFGGAGTAREPAGKGATTYSGARTIQVEGSPSAPVQLTLNSLARDTTYGRGSLYITGVSNSLGANEKLKVGAGNEPAVGPGGVDGIGIVAPYMVNANANFLGYDGNGFKTVPYDISANDVPGLNAATSNDVVYWSGSYDSPQPRTLTQDVHVYAIRWGDRVYTTAGNNWVIYIHGGGLISHKDGYGNNEAIANPIDFGAMEGVFAMFNNGGNFAVSADIRGSGGVTKFGPRTLQLDTAAKTFTGTVTVNEGWIYLTSPTASYNSLLGGTAGNWTPVMLNGGGVSVGNTDMTLDHVFTIGPNGGSFSQGNGGRSLTVSTAVTGPGRLSVYGPGKVVVTNTANSYSGGTYVSNGTLEIGAGSGVGSGAVALSGGALNFSGSPAQTYPVASLAGSGNVTLGPGTGSGTTTLIVGRDGTSTTLTGNISDQNTGSSRLGALVKAGGGTFRVTGACTYTGNTLVSNGTLIVNGSLTSPVVVTNAGSGFGGNATVTKPVTIGDGCVLTPGDSGVGALTTGDLTLSASSTSFFDIATTNASDKVTVNGNLALAGTFSVTKAPGFTPGRFAIMTYTGALTDGGPTTIAPPGYNARFERDTAAQIIWLVVTKRTGTLVFIK